MRAGFSLHFKADIYFLFLLVLYFILLYHTNMREVKYHSSNNIVYSCKYHVVFAPNTVEKYWSTALTPD